MVKGLAFIKPGSLADAPRSVPRCVCTGALFPTLALPGAPTLPGVFHGSGLPSTDRLQLRSVWGVTPSQKCLSSSFDYFKLPT